MRIPAGTWLWRNALVCIAYALTGMAGMGVHYLGSSATLVWPPSGLAVAALVRWGYPSLPGIFLGSFLLKATAGDGLAISLWVAVGNMLGPLATTLLLRWVGFRPEFSRRQDLVWFPLCLAAGMTVVGTVGVGTLCLRGLVPASGFGEMWLLWWMGDFVGGLMTGPPLLTVTRDWVLRLRRQAWEFVGLTLATLGVAFALVSNSPSNEVAALALVLISLPVVVWAAIRFEATGAAWTSVILSATVALATASGTGPFYKPNLHQGLMLLWSFIGTTAFICLVIPPLQFERREVAESLRSSRATLDAIRLVQQDYIAAPDKGGAFRRLLDVLLSHTGSRHGFISEVLHDGGRPYLKTHALSNLAWDEATRRLYEEHATTGGLEFHNLETLFGRVLTTGKRVLSNAPAEDPRRGGLPPGHPPLENFLGLPLFIGDQLVGVVGLANRAGGYREEQLAGIETLLSTCAGLIGAHREDRARLTMEASQRQLEAQLRHVQKMEAIGTLAGGIAHDFNNLLGTILGNVELAMQDVGPGHVAQESLGEISKASLRAKLLVQQILAFSRRQETVKTTVSLADLVPETVQLLRATLPAGVEIVTRIDPGTPSVRADATQIHQVIVNLCTNSWHSMQGRPGTITLEVCPAAGPPGTGDDSPWACLRVTDTGSGMEPETLERIFEPFFTTKAPGEGTGLGLSVVHGIVQDHGGTIRVASQPGRGSRFDVLLRGAPSQALPDPSKPALAPTGSGERILYVDDEISMVQFVQRLFPRLGYQVSVFTRPQEALSALRADVGAFDLVVTDFNMPGMSGLEVAREVRNLRPGLPVVMTSGYITEELPAMATNAGVRHLIHKPETVEELCRTVDRFILRRP